MKPIINNTEFGSITIDKETFSHDVYVTSNGDIRKRKKKLSKEITGSSHDVSVEEIKYCLEAGTEALVIGSGQYGALALSEEATEYLKEIECKVLALPTPDAIKAWNNAEETLTGLFHVTC